MFREDREETPAVRSAAQPGWPGRPHSRAGSVFSPVQRTLAWPQAGERPLAVGGGKGRAVELSAGSVNTLGVKVERVKVGPRVGHLVIDRSRGVQVGDGNRQLNNFRFTVQQPRVSPNDLLRWHPARQRAFANLVANPDSRVANWVFRQHLSPTARPTGNVRFISAAAPRGAHIAARVDDRGQLVVDRSRGVQIGSRTTQLNNFNYRVEQPKLSLEPMLRDNPELARGLALTARYPGNAAAERSFTGRLARAYENPGNSISAAPALPRGTDGLVVRHGVGVQLGHGNDRTDIIDVRVDRIRLTHWKPPSPMPQPRDSRPAWPTIASRATERVTPDSPGRLDPSASRISPSTRSPGGLGRI